MLNADYESDRDGDDIDDDPTEASASPPRKAANAHQDPQELGPESKDQMLKKIFEVYSEREFDVVYELL